ncbi:MAG: N-acetylmuramidase family protein [Bacteroidota bacterium]
MKTGISSKSFANAAKKIGCEIRAIKAVYKVESKGSGFLPNGHPIILFEPHIFWKELRKVGITPIVSDVCYPKWGEKPYGKVSEQPARMEKASKINREAALKSASWGLFQILGMNYKLCGCETLQEFINKNYESEEAQLELFVNYIMNSYLDDELRDENWVAFASQYNGPLYWKNNYDGKLNTACNLITD